MQPYHTLKGWKSRLPSLFKVCGNPDANLSHFELVEVTLAKSFLRFVEIQMQSYHTLKGSRSRLPSFFKVCGNPDATLSHFEGDMVLECTQKQRVLVSFAQKAK